ncbi:MAG: hypothetical protein IME97_09085 [Proteobacteria bacterium]|nr:hypothetical protein [Pseudomonadota bacterium]
MNRGTGITYYGKVDKDDPTIIHYWASYIEDAGVLTERMTFHRNDETSGNGKSFWSWSDGLMNCGGEYSFTATREEK